MIEAEGRPQVDIPLIGAYQAANALTAAALVIAPAASSSRPGQLARVQPVAAGSSGR